MNSFRTHDDTLAALAPYDDLAVDGLELDFVQSQEPKLLADDLSPVSGRRIPAWNGALLVTATSTPRWSPPACWTGWSRWATATRSVSNSDNLGAAPDATLAGWFAASGAPYAAEVCRRTAADRKGGHLAIRKADEPVDPAGHGADGEQ